MDAEIGQQGAKGHQETFGDNGCIHYLDCGDGFKDIYVKIYQIVYFVSQLYLTKAVLKKIEQS